jgi:hypothetical protein
MRDSKNFMKIVKLTVFKQNQADNPVLIPHDPYDLLAQKPKKPRGVSAMRQ